MTVRGRADDGKVAFNFQESGQSLQAEGGIVDYERANTPWGVSVGLVGWLRGGIGCAEELGAVGWESGFIEEFRWYPVPVDLFHVHDEGCGVGTNC